MSLDESLAEYLIENSEKKDAGFVLKLDGKDIPLHDVSVFRSENPVDRPTRRGNVYLSDKFSYKLRGTVMDTSIIPVLSKKMLGPNTDFAEMEVAMSVDGQEKSVSVFANLTNSMHNSEKVELNLAIVRMERS